MFEVRPGTATDRPWIIERLTEWWASPTIVTRGRLVDASTMPAFIAVENAQRLGLATYEMKDAACELVTLNSFAEGRGIGAALVDAVADAARDAGCRRLWLITTNDNLPALRFYQKRGFHLVAVHRGALDRSRALKPQIPTIGLHGIPLRDEIELEMLL